MAIPADASTGTSSGLSDAEARARRARGLGNTAAPPTVRTYWQILVGNVFTFINGALFLLGVSLMLVGRPTDAFVSSFVIALNVVLSVVQEMGAKHKLDRIALMTRPKATVMRDGQALQLSPQDLVLGDTLRIGAGDQIVLDGTVIEGRMAVDESQLTGESDLIPKKAGDPVYSTSYCVSGSAYYVAEKVGEHNMANQILAGARAFRRVLTPLQSQVYLFIRVMFLLVLYIALLLLVRGFISQVLLAQSLQHLTLVAGLVPNGLFLSITVAYALGAVRILRHGVLVQQSNAIESLSNVDVLCLDKTGTLTTNRLKLHAVHALNGSEADVRRALGAMVASTSSPNKTSDAIAAELPAQKLRVAAEVPFSSARKWSAVVLDDASISGVYALGASEMLRPYLRPSDAEWLTIAATASHLADQGLRVLLVAHHPAKALEDKGDESLLPKGMTPLGLVSLSDELRPLASEVLAEFVTAGVRPKIISGDHQETVAALAKLAGLGSDLKMVSGPELDLMGESEFNAAAASATIFGRISPEQKQKLIKALRADGHYVAMIGDGVNDVLALKQANLGVAMQSGSQATRAIADLVLMKDTFASLAPAVKEGQRILNGMQDILKLFVSRVATMALVILSALVIGEFPLELRQGSLISLFSVAIPATMMAFWAGPGPLKKDAMAGEVFRFILTPTIVTSVVSLLLYHGTLVLLLIEQAGSLATALTADAAAGFYDSARVVAHTTLTAFLVLCGLLLVVFVAPPTKWWAVGDELSKDRRPTILACGLLAAFVTILSVPQFRDVFALSAFGLQEIGLFTGSTLIWLFVSRWLWRHRTFERLMGLSPR